MADTTFPIVRDVSAKYSVHTGDPVQNMLAPYIKEMTSTFQGVTIRAEYIDLHDAYNLLKRALTAPTQKESDKV